MSVIIGHFEFEGPLASMSEVPAAPGLYAVLHQEKAAYYLLDFALSENLARTAPNVLEFDDDSKLVVLKCKNKRKRIEIFENILEDVHSVDVPHTVSEALSDDAHQAVPQAVHEDYSNRHDINKAA